MIATLCLASIFSFVSTPASLAPRPPSKSQEGQVRPMNVNDQIKRMFHLTKNCRDKPQIMQDFRITPYINNIMHTAFVQRKQKAEQY